MLKKLLRTLFTFFGAILGYGVFELLLFWMEKSDVDVNGTFTQAQQIGAGIVFAIIFGIIFFRLTPAIKRQSLKVADNIENDLSGISANDLLSGVIGLILGLLIAFLITQIYVSITNKYLYTVITIITYMVLGYLGVVIANRKGKEMFSMLVTYNKQKQYKEPRQDAFFSKSSKKKREGIPKILDTSVIIDGRIAEIMKTGFLEGLSLFRSLFWLSFATLRIRLIR